MGMGVKIATEIACHCSQILLEFSEKLTYHLSYQAIFVR